MSKYEYLKALSSTITDPEKLRSLLDIPECILAIVARDSSINEDEGKKLDRYPLARKARIIFYNNLTDYSSRLHKQWENIEDKFRSNRNFVPYEELRNNSEVLALAKRELPPSHPRKLGEPYGIKIVGAIPRSKNKVEVLATHHQYKWYKEPGYGDIYTLDTFESKKYNIPQAVTTGELKSFDPFETLTGSLIHALATMRDKKLLEPKKVDVTQLEYFVTLPSFGRKSEYFEVSLPF